MHTYEGGITWATPTAMAPTVRGLECIAADDRAWLPPCSSQARAQRRLLVIDEIRVRCAIDGRRFGSCHGQ